MKLSELAEEYAEGRSWVMLTPDQCTKAAIEATRFYAAYGNIASISLSETQPGAPEPNGTLPAPADPPPDVNEALPIKNLAYIGEDTEVSVGEWAIIRSLFWLYAERENSLLQEASRSSGIEPFGRSSSEISQDITVMENETLPAKAFYAVATTIE